MTPHATTRALLAAAALALLLLPGCGILYRHVTKPLDLNLQGESVHIDNGERRALRNAESDTRHLTINSARVEWGNRGIGYLAKRFRMSQVNYADRETMTILWFWRQEWVHIYGK